jgi:hypothetical protein
MDEGYSRDLETFNFTLVLYITKRGPAFDVPEDKSTNTNTNTNKKRDTCNTSQTRSNLRAQ